VSVVLVLAVIALAWFARYAMLRHVREQEAARDRPGDFLWRLDHDLDQARLIRRTYDEEAMRRVSARRFRELIGVNDETP
jgi:hypothetical protein